MAIQLRVVQYDEPEEPKGDPSLTAEAMASWTPGQRLCRARGRHPWGPFMVYEHRTFREVVEQCPHCRNRRSADFVVTPGGLRQVTKWKPDYRSVRGADYLLPRGAARLDEDQCDELTAADILNRKTIEVLDDDE